MTTRTCDSCVFGTVVKNSHWPTGQWRCMRAARFRNGEYDDVLGVGRSAEMERDSLPEPQRWPGDKCSKEGLNWKERVNP